MIRIERYTPESERQWNEFVAQSRNATFMADRRYMDYHSDRFPDFSLMAFDDRDRLLAVMPATRLGDEVVSHAGLTFGGWLMAPRRCDALDMLEITDATLACLRDSGVKKLVYRPAPHIYHSQPAEEDLYALVRAGAVIDRMLVSSVVDLDNPLSFDQGSRQRARKVLASPDIVVAESVDFKGFWEVLTCLLDERYGSKPVHTLAEITMLRDRFPANIRLFTASDRDSGQLLGGVVMYISATAAHSQYTAASLRGKELSVIPAVYRYIMDELRGSVRWLDFGTSNEHGGREVNPGLLRQKCSYGGRAVVYPSYSLSIS